MNDPDHLRISYLDCGSLAATKKRVAAKGVAAKVPMPYKRRKSKELTQQVQLQTRNWSELPSDLMLNILQRVGVVDILENAQKVCTAWHEISKVPALWSVIHMNSLPDQCEWVYVKMCEQAVDRSQGQLVDLSIIGFGNLELLKYVAERSSQLRRLEVLYFVGSMICDAALKNYSFLEELILDGTKLSKEDIEAADRYCPLLKILKVKQNSYTLYYTNDDKEEWITIDNEIALEIGKNLPKLTHLELTGNCMKDGGLIAILDGCCHIESLDLSGCDYLNLKGDLRKRCSQQIKHLKLPCVILEYLDEPYLDYD